VECPRCHELASPAAFACGACAAPLRFGEEPPPARLDRTLDLDRRLGRREERTEPARFTEPLPVAGDRGVDLDLERDRDRDRDLDPDRDLDRDLDLDLDLDPDLDRRLEPAPLRLVAAAALVDGAAVAAATLLPVLAAAWMLPAGVELTRALLSAALALAALVVVAYGVLGNVLLGATPGECWLRIAATDETGRTPGMGRAVLRLALALFGTLGLGAGLWSALFTQSRRTLHDRVTGTHVVRAP
jgi:uncharacterized RDD family membrane protein YckC